MAKVANGLKGRSYNLVQVSFLSFMRYSILAEEHLILINQLSSSSFNEPQIYNIEFPWTQ